MSWYVKQFRQAVENGRDNQLRARQGRSAVAAGYTATAGLIEYAVYGSGDPRPDPLRSPFFGWRRLWVAQSIGAVIRDRPAVMTIVSSKQNDDELYQHVAFSAAHDTKPVLSIWQTVEVPRSNDTMLQEQLMLWAKRPGSHPGLYETIELPPKFEDNLGSVLPPATDERVEPA